MDSKEIVARLYALEQQMARTADEFSLLIQDIADEDGDALTRP